MASFSEYMDSVFGGLIVAAGRFDLSGKLKTKDLPPDRKPEQFQRLSDFRMEDDALLRLIDGRFIGRFSNDEDTFLCVHVQDVDENGIRSIDEFLFDYGAEHIPLDESMFLFLALNMQGYFNIKQSKLSMESARNIVDVAYYDDYNGHDIFDVINLFDEIRIFSIGKNSPLSFVSMWYIATFLSSLLTDYRTTLFSQNLCDRAIFLLANKNINPEYLYYTITSIHWKQSFLEIYKCIESIYYLPWIVRYKKTISDSTPGHELAKKLRVSLGWREKGDKSISELFQLLSYKELVAHPAISTEIFSHCVSGAAAPNVPARQIEAIARRVYKIRNMLVHQEDYEDPSPLHITEKCWEDIIDFMFFVVSELYTQNSENISFNYRKN